jgi:hypothetical protein
MKYFANFVLVSLVALVLCTGAVAQTTIKITGYATGESKVNTDIERQLVTNVVKPIQTATSATPNHKLSIYVFGSTDRTGSIGANDDLGRKRAEDVRSYLMMQFPDASIIVQSKGDMENTRMVTVSWKVIPIATPVATLLTHGQKMWLIIGTAFLALLLLVMKAKSATTQTEPESQPQATEIIPAPAPVVREPKQMKIIGEDGNTYQVFITPKNDGWESPFTINGRPIFFANDRGIVKSLRGCVKSDATKEFRDQLAQLIASGKIIKIEKE